MASKLFNRLRSTDKDLLVMQRVLGGIRFTKATQAQLDSTIAHTKVKLTERFVQEKLSTSVVTKAKKAGPRLMTKAFNMTVTIQVKNVKIDTGHKFTTSATFSLKNVLGKGVDAHAALYAAKEAFRLHIGNNLRDANSTYRQQFEKYATAIPMDPEEEMAQFSPSELRDLKADAIEKFRLWLGVALRDKSSKYLPVFFDKVVYDEQYVTKVCKECNERQIELNFLTHEGMQDVCAGCRKALAEAVPQLPGSSSSYVSADELEVDEDDDYPDEDDEE